MRSPRVLVLARNYPNTAFPTLGLWTERLVQASTRVATPTVVAPVPYAPPFIPSTSWERFRSIAAADQRSGVTVHHPRIPAGPGQLLHAWDATLAYRSLRRTVAALHRTTPFDVIHSHFIYPEGVVASRIGVELGIPVVSSEHAMWKPWLDRHPAVRRQVERAIPGIARITAVSEALRGTILEIIGDAVPVDVVPNVVDERTFAAPGPDDVRDPHHLLFVGLIRRVKGLDVLMQALGHLLLDHPDLHLTVAGGAFYRAYERDAAAVKSLVEALGIGHRVRFLGEVAPGDVAALMRRCAVLVVPSRRETFSLVTAEALASGMPVVATRCGGPEEILTDETGELVDVDDPAALAVAIERVLARTYDSAKLRRYAVERFGTAAAADRLGRLYEQVTGQPRVATPASGQPQTVMPSVEPDRIQSVVAGGIA